jgi:hypothetical protein
MTAQPVTIFDGHNDVLLRLHRRAGGDPVAAFLDGEDAGQLDFVKARKGGFAGGLFAIFVPPVRKKNADGTQAGLTTSDAPAVDLAEAQRVTFAMAALLLRIELPTSSTVSPTIPSRRYCTSKARKRSIRTSMCSMCCTRQACDRSARCGAARMRSVTAYRSAARHRLTPAPA